MSCVNKPQKSFILLLLSVLVVFQGKATFRNLSRYSDLCEKSFSRWYRRSFDFLTFNALMLLDLFSKTDELIAALDASFMDKSGKHTSGLGKFWSGCAGQAKKGLEISLLSIVDLKSNTAYALDAQQTIDKKGKTRVDLYAQQVIAAREKLNQLNIRYLAVDAYYFKKKFVFAVRDECIDLHVIGKLRHDANLLWPWEGGYSGKGRPKIYDGKVDFNRHLSRFTYVGMLDKETEIHTAKVYSQCLECWVCVVMLRFQKKHKTSYALLYSTDTELDAMTLVKYYKARFQIEFFFRDAKQFTGLTDCQARKKEAIHTHINASCSALNALKLEDQRKKNTREKSVISISSWKRLKFNQNLLCRLFSKLGFSLNDEKVRDIYAEFSKYGAIAA